MRITKNMKMAEAIHKNYLLLPIISRFGIDLGFGDSTVENICRVKDIEEEFFLDIVNSFLDDQYFPKKHMAAFSSSQIIRYLQKTHQYYLEEKIPLIESMIKKLVQTSQADKNKLKLIGDFFAEYKNELHIHIKREDDLVYPYVLELEKYYNEESKNTPLPDSLKKYSILEFADEHDNMEEKLYDLKSILIKYLPPQDDQKLLHEIITELFELEKDLADHSRIEDKVLIPKIAELEKEINEKQKT